MNLVFFVILVIFGLMVLIEPLIDNRRLLFSQPVRMRIIHTLFSTRIWLFSFFQQRSNATSQHQALEEIVQLHYPPLYLKYAANDIDLTEFRSSAKRIFTGLYPQRNVKTCKVEPITFEYHGRQVRAYSIRNGDIHDWKEDGQQFILYIHGGSFVYGDIEIYSGYECSLSSEHHMPVIHIEYGLIPDRTIAEAIDDVVTVYMSMLKFDSNIHRRIIGMGDSSGGLLWLRLIQIIVKQEHPAPRALVLFSPWVDLSFLHIAFDASTEQNRILFSLQLLINLRQHALSTPEDDMILQTDAELNRKLIGINPCEYSFQGFPPLYVTVGTDEVFLWDAIVLKNKIEENNGQIILEEGYGLMHSYPMFHLWSPEARCSQRNIKQFIEQF